MLTYLSEEEIDQLALDRSATARTFSVSYAKPLNDMFQVTLDATLANISASPASGGVEVVPATGNDYYYSALARQQRAQGERRLHARPSLR